MKILVLNDYGSATGGAEMITASLRKELRRRGHNVRMFVSNARASLHSIDPDYECYGTVGSLRTISQCINLRAAFSLGRVLRQFRPDVVHVNLYLTQLSPWILPVIRGVPSVYYAVWNRAICPLGTRRTPDGKRCTNTAGTSCLKSRCLRFHDWLPLMGQLELDRRWRDAFTRVVAISRSVTDQLDEFGQGKLRYSSVIYPGTPLVAPRNCMSERPLVVFAGRLVPEKGGEILLRAFAKVLGENPACRLAIAGDGPQRPVLESLSESLALGDSVAFLGHKPQDEVVDLVREAWVVCVPSLWDEPFGLIAAEAQMNGVAVIASSTGGLMEIIRDGETGFLVEPGHSGALAKSIGELLANRKQAIAMGIAGHEHARDRFSIEAFGDQFEQLYRSILKAKSAVGGKESKTVENQIPHLARAVRGRRRVREAIDTVEAHSR